jgi:uncharacterized protein YjdB
MKRLCYLLAFAATMFAGCDPEPTQVAVKSVTVAPTELTLEVGDTGTLEATVLPANADVKTVTWSSSKPNIVSVDAVTGEILAVTHGEAVITATTDSGYKTATCNVTVNRPVIVVESVSVAPPTLTLDVDGTATLTATVLPTNADNKTVKWSTNAPTIVEVDIDTGEVTAVAPGQATITATTDDGGKKASCVVTVNTPPIPVENVTVAPSSVTLVVGGTATFVATVLPANATNKTVSWSSSAPGIAEVNPTTGKVTAVAPGQATITVTTEDGGKTASASVTVNAPHVAVESVTVAPTTLSLNINGTSVLTATVLPENATNKNVSWASNNTSVATVSSAGLVTARAVGSATITVTTQEGGHTATCQVTVTSQYYTSTDYSNDGRVTALQTATVGNGVNIIMLGDGFSDRLIADGTYERVMRTGMEYFFTEPTYIGLRDMFNFYMVDVVSANEVFTSTSDTALDCTFDPYSTLISGNDNMCRQYALKVITQAQMNETLIIVITNSTTWHGTCYMYAPSAGSGDHGPGHCISYSTRGQNPTSSRQLLVHEVGHGYPKLADEYFYSNSGTIDAQGRAYYNSRIGYGWFKNIDLISDPERVKWAKYLTDPRYDGQGLGVFEGGDVFRYGVWRPTFNSMMRENIGGFNAPSREAIYYRTNKLAFGTSWQYDHETFVAWDLASIAAHGVAARNAYGDDQITPMQRPYTPPVHIPYTWQEADAMKLREQRP